jgi:hypothetical protein
MRSLQPLRIPALFLALVLLPCVALSQTSIGSSLDARPPALDRPMPVGDGQWEQLTPPGRLGHVAVLDPVGNRMIVFGGARNSAYLYDTWSLSLDTHAWTRLAPTGTPPDGREWACAVYDPLRNRVLLLGGMKAIGPSGELWALGLSGTPAWSLLSTTGTTPGTRTNAAAIYDPNGDRLVIFGGQAINNEVWAVPLGTPSRTWAHLAPGGTPPAARFNCSAVYDAARRRMVIFGGTDGSSNLNDAWALPLTGSLAWTQLATTGTPPSARENHVAVYDAANDRMVVSGGWSGSPLNDAWALDCSTLAWTQLAPGGLTPREGYGHTAIYDPAAGRMLVYGGWSGSVFNGLLQLSLGGSPAWSSPVPTPRRAARAIDDPVRDRIIVFGGLTAAGLTNEAWALSRSGQPTWTLLAPTGTPPSVRSGSAIVYDPVRDRMIVFGGYDNAAWTALNEVWALSLSGTPAWTQLAPTGTPPSGRQAMSTLYDPVRDRMLIFGGVDYNNLNDTWALSLAGTPAWSQLAPTGTPPPVRFDASAIYDPVADRMVIFGGGAGTLYNDVWALSLAGTPAWAQLAPTGTPPDQRYTHTSIYDPVRARMVMFGGAGNYFYNDVWALSLTESPAWTQLAPAPSYPSGRYGQVGTYDPDLDRLWIIGGADAYDLLNDIWALEWGVPLEVGGPAPAALGFLRSPVPNPARGWTALSYSIPRAGRVRLEIFDATGRRVRRLVDAERGAGPGTAGWNGTADDGTRLRSGVYFVRLDGPGVRTARRLVVIE